MLQNYFKIALRKLVQNTSYTIINITGLAFGIMSAMVIFLIVKNELSYEQFNSKADRTYRVTIHSLDYNPSVSFAVAPAFRTDLTEAENVSQYFTQSGGLIKVDDDLYNEPWYGYADNEFMKIFDFEWIAGNRLTGLSEPDAIILTESLARKYFGGTDVIGRVLKFDNRRDLHVTGVIKDLPSNTHFLFSFLVSWATVEKDFLTNNFWSISGGSLYVTLPDARMAGRIAEQLDPFLKKNWGEEAAKEADLILQPLREIHFDQKYIQQASMPRSKDSIYGLAAIAIFILITVSINFVNLATVQAIKRLKEVGIRKALGAYRKQLMFQVLIEITLLVTFSIVIALAGILAFAPLIATLLKVNIGPQHLLTNDFIFTVLAVSVSIVLLAGLYPAVVQSAAHPIDALKSNAMGTGRISLSARALIILQFSISQLLIIATIVAGSQMEFFTNRDIGFVKDAVISFPAGAKSDVLYQELKNLPGVQDIASASASPTHNSNFADFSCPELGMTDVDVTEIKEIDDNYLTMFRIDLLSGEPFVKREGRDSILNVIVNETLIKRMGVSEAEKAIGQKVMIENTPTIIQGVVKDFQSESKHKKIRALVLVYAKDGNGQVSVKLDPTNMTETLTAIGNIWTRLNPGYLFNYEFLDQRIAGMYKQEQQTYNAIMIFSGIAILIGSLGLYALVSWMAVQRKKEIGIRKVLGASVKGIVFLFYRQFILLLVVAFLFAAPLAWYAMNQWLQEFAYHIDINPAIFAVSILTTIGVATVTIGYQTIRAATTNPANSLRSN
ncbi:MAG: ABC transporter permease [Chryseolinea sp.]